MKGKGIRFFVTLLAALFIMVTAAGCAQTPAAPQAPAPSPAPSETPAPEPAPAQPTLDYPKKAIEVYVGYAAGGATDIATRLMTPFMEELLKQPVTVVNKPGGGAEIAYTALAQATPDGYTLGVINSPTVIALPLSHKTQYSLDDFALIGNVSFDENVIVAKVDGPYQTLEDLIAKAQGVPGELTLGHSGAYADDHLASLAFQQAAGIQLNDTAFQGTAPSLVAVIGGHIDVVVGNVADVVEQVKQGQLVVLATMGEVRNPLLPDAPTLKEKGIDVVMGSYRALAAPAATPPEILQLLRDTLGDVAQNQEYITRSDEAQQPVTYLNAEDFEKVLQNDKTKLEKLWKDLDLPTE